MSFRRAVTLIETLIVIAILALLLGLVIPAVQKVRQSAKRTESKNNIRQILLAVHGYASNHGDDLPGCKDWSKPYTSDGDVPNLFLQISPYTESPINRKGLGVNDELGFYVKLFIDPSDPTYHGPVNDGKLGNTSYAFNIYAFQGASRKLSSLFKDGQSNTIGFSTHYMRCGVAGGLGRVGQFKWHQSQGEPNTVVRRATFADSHYSDVVPITDYVSGRVFTIPSRPHATFQAAPAPAECDPTILQSPYPSVLVVALMDGSVRDISKRIEPTIFWAAVTPAGGETFEWE